MWTKYELEKIGEIYEKLPKEYLEDFAPQEVVEAIMDEEGRAYENLGLVFKLKIKINATLSNTYFVPKHTKARKTIRFVRLMTGFNVGDWLKELLSFMRVSVDITISIGFSFIGRKNHWKLDEGEKELIYYYAAPDLCTLSERFNKMQDAKRFADDVSQMDYADFLHETFMETESGDPFVNSGISPHALIANFIWITK